MYKILDKQLKSLLEGESNFISNASNFTALLHQNLENINWVGFYFANNGKLKLGPFQGQVACMTIETGKGVCGTSFANKKTIIVANVDEFKGHIVCNLASKSELVIPIIKDGVTYGVLDIDSPIMARFSEEDKVGVELLVTTLVNLSDLVKVGNYYK